MNNTFHLKRFRIGKILLLLISYSCSFNPFRSFVSLALDAGAAKWRERKHAVMNGDAIELAREDGEGVLTAK